MPNISAGNISKIRLAEQGSDPAAPAATFWLLYVKSDGVYVIDDGSNITGPLAELGAGATQAAAGNHNHDLAYAGITHASQHQNGGSDEVATATPGANSIPKTGAGTTLDKGWIPDFVGSGASHANGGVPDPGAGAGTTKYLREDATWDVPAGSGMADPMSAAGDMIRRSAANSTEALAIGTVGQILTARGGTLIPTWETQYSTLNFIIDGGGAAITTGVKGDVVVDFACNLISWTLLADTSGDIKIDIWRDSYANYPPTDADTITNAHEPEIPASGVKAQDTDLSDWITNPPAIAAGQTLRFNVDSCTTITRCTIALKVARI